MSLPYAISTPEGELLAEAVDERGAWLAARVLIFEGEAQAVVIEGPGDVIVVSRVLKSREEESA